MPSKRRLLIAGGGYGDIPMIQAAKKAGYYVITTGNKPQDLGHQYSDHYEFADFSDCEKILDISKKYKIAAICASCNDFAAISASYVAEKLNLPGHDTYENAQTIHHKDKFRDFCKKNDIPIPGDAQSFSTKSEAVNAINKITKKLIIKPVDLTGGKGISIVDNQQNFSPALEKAFAVSRTKRIVIEDFIEGSRHAFSAYIHNCKVVFYFSDNEHYYLNPFMVSAASTPGLVPVSAEQELCQITENIAMKLDLKTGIFHVQYILVNEKPIIIEACRRPPGDLYVKLVELSTGVDFPAYIVDGAAGTYKGGLNFKKPTGFYTRHCIMAPKAGRIKNVTYKEVIRKNVVEQLVWWRMNSKVIDYTTEKLGIVFLKFENQNEMIEKTNQMFEFIKVEIE